MPTIVRLQRRRDRPGGRFRIYFTDDGQLAAWQTIKGRRAMAGKVRKRETIEPDEIDALEELGVRVRIEESVA